MNNHSNNDDVFKITDEQRVSSSNNKRNRADSKQLSILENVAAETLKPNRATRHKLSEELGMSPRQVQIWFQNKRAKLKKLTHGTKSSVTKKQMKMGRDVGSEQYLSNYAYTGQYAHDVYTPIDYVSRDPYVAYPDSQKNYLSSEATIKYAKEYEKSGESKSYEKNKEHPYFSSFGAMPPTFDNRVIEEYGEMNECPFNANIYDQRGVFKQSYESLYDSYMYLPPYGNHPQQQLEPYYYQNVEAEMSEEGESEESDK